MNFSVTYLKYIEMKIQLLTKAEEQVMQYLWKISKGFLKDILEALVKITSCFD